MTIASCMDAGEVEEAFKVVSVLNWDLTYCRTHRSQHTWRNASRKTSQSVWRHSRSNRTPLYVLLHEVNSRRSLMQGEDWVSPMFVPKQRVGNMGAFRWPWVKAVWHENKWTSQERWTFRCFCAYSSSSSFIYSFVCLFVLAGAVCGRLESRGVRV